MSLADHQQSRVAAFESVYPLTIDKQYAVVGMDIAETVFRLLIRDDYGDARFSPAGLFALFRAPLPAGWHFALAAGIQASGRSLWTDPVVATWGYPELVEDPNHYSALVDEDPDAVAVFARRISEAEWPNA